MNPKPRFKPIKKTFQLSADGALNVTLSINHTRTGFVVREKQTNSVATFGPFSVFEGALETFERRSAILSVSAAKAGFPLEYEQKKTGRMVPCTGEAHSNPHIDHCMVCMPRWGEVEELLPVDLDDAKKRRLDVPAYMLRDEPLKDMLARSQSGEVELVSVNRGNSHYSVFRWTGKS